MADDHNLLAQLKDSDLPVAFHDNVYSITQVTRGTQLEHLVAADFVHMGPGRESSLHRHVLGYAVVFITGGSGEVLLTEAGTPLPVAKGDRVVIPANTFHGFRTLEDSLDFLSVQSPPILDLSSGVLDLEFLLPQEQREKHAAAQLAKMTQEEREHLASLTVHTTLKDSSGKIAAASMSV